MNKKVLYIEDNTALAEAFGKEAVAQGYEFNTTDNGSEALAVAIESKPDVIITGILMPGINGFELIEALKSNPETKHIPVVVVSALSRDEDEKRALELGAANYFVSTETTISAVIAHVGTLLK